MSERKPMSGTELENFRRMLNNKPKGEKEPLPGVEVIRLEDLQKVEFERLRYFYETGWSYALIGALEKYNDGDDDGLVRLPRWVVKAAARELRLSGLAPTRALVMNSRRWSIVQLFLDSGYNTYSDSKKTSSSDSAFQKASKESARFLGEHVGESAMRKAYYEIEKLRKR